MAAGTAAQSTASMRLDQERTVGGGTIVETTADGGKLAAAAITLIRALPGDVDAASEQQLDAITALLR